MDPEWILNTSLSQGTSSSSSGSVLFICVFVQVFHCRVSERRCLTSHVIPCHPGPLASSRWGRWDIARVARGLVHPVAPHRLFSFNSFEHASSIQFNCLSLSLPLFQCVPSALWVTFGTGHPPLGFQVTMPWCGSPTCTHSHRCGSLLGRHVSPVRAVHRCTAPWHARRHRWRRAVVAFGLVGLRSAEAPVPGAIRDEGLQTTGLWLINRDMEWVACTDSTMRCRGGKKVIQVRADRKL